MGNANAFRAVGLAIGSNPVAFLIPCHRVIQSSGNVSQNMWGKQERQLSSAGKVQNPMFGKCSKFRVPTAQTLKK